MPAPTFIPQPETRQMTARQGADFFQDLTWKEDGQPVDITGSTSRFVVREHADDSDPATAEWASASEITIDGPNGNLKLFVPASLINPLPQGRFRYEWQVVLVDGRTGLLLEGEFFINQGIAR